MSVDVVDQAYRFLGQFINKVGDGLKTFAFSPALNAIAEALAATCEISLATSITVFNLAAIESTATNCDFT